jgi:hypothetical protein
MTTTLEMCHDCAVSPGEKHKDGCDVARCLECGFQRISCEHEESDLGWGEIWTGEWPGELECREFGLWVKNWDDRNPGWVKTTAEDPVAIEDLNALHELAATGMVRWNGRRWVKPE